MRVAVIGLGVMGRVAAEAAKAQGHEIVASDPAARAVDAAKALAIGFEVIPENAVIGADVVLLFLPGPPQIRAVIPKLIPKLSDGSVIVDHSTADPGTAEEMAALAAEGSIGWIDAPVLGRPTAVGSWALPVGQTEGALDRARSVLDCYAKAIYEVGGPGVGHTVKLLNQMMFGAINAMTAEMMATAQTLGLPPARLYEIITASQAGTVSNLFKELGARIARDDYDNPTFSVKLLEKDVRLGLEMARKAGMEPRLGRVVAAMNDEAIAGGFGDRDTSSMWLANLTK
ncbi:3-hydroxyisobutyrate dehydrogenase/2-hydroxy-3-oxopropionate reductase [Palleronia aestuarii]|uniref:3-hydroxyisobutyrate dehydrogenase/2-hydroxy-3-oxopropionate reductase n=1 Tax=Palleronia aestuarii TaxID=568105 RepID=A0A2W7MTK0_9RHOB|nr:NAD(P)-dependent oxidoreductase [Palleronia aestuarii]PZX11298.1 3-hydroxyisobutyrate dehydrogenase/2-hydroxy-3-oxopropionate reductase [Palleronia aestuarii]